MQCVSETEILEEQQTPQEVLVCDHAGLVIDNLSLLCFGNLSTSAMVGYLGYAQDSGFRVQGSGVRI